MQKRAEAFLKKLSGNYLLVRSVRPENLVIEGLANFILLSETNLLYQERGSYLINGLNYNFTNSNYFVIKNNQLVIEDQEKQIRYKLDLENLLQTPINFTSHLLCNQDNYTLNFSYNENLIKIDYQIFGPKKNHFIESQLYKHNY
jgi:hypothetical protein